MLSANHERIAAFYTGLMNEARNRLEWVVYALNGKTGMPRYVAEDFVYLQLRMLCEIVGLACIVAHGDNPSTRSKRVLKRWSAADMLLELEKLTPDFYPQPHDQVRATHMVDGKSVGGFHFQKRAADYLTKFELIKLYGRCGDHLHRGSAKNILANRPYPPSARDELAKFAQKLANLLGIHRIQLLGGEAQLICVMYPMDGDIMRNEVAVAFGYPIDDT